MHTYFIVLCETLQRENFYTKNPFSSYLLEEISLKNKLVEKRVKTAEAATSDGAHMSSYPPDKVNGTEW